MSVLIVYASLFPFSGWRAPGLEPWMFLAAPLPPYWTGFDVTSNLIRIRPTGFLLALALLRTGWTRGAVLVGRAGGFAAVAGHGVLQIYLPRRVPSNLDLVLNAAGMAGRLAGGAVGALGAIDRWSLFRGRWFVPDARARWC